MDDPPRVLEERICKACGHRWFPRSFDRPRICPKCKSARWDVGPRFPKRERPADNAAALAAV